MNTKLAREMYPGTLPCMSDLCVEKIEQPDNCFGVYKAVPSQSFSLLFRPKD